MVQRWAGNGTKICEFLSILTSENNQLWFTQILCPGCSVMFFIRQVSVRAWPSERASELVHRTRTFRARYAALESNFKRKLNFYDQNMNKTLDIKIRLFYYLVFLRYRSLMVLENNHNHKKRVFSAHNFDKNLIGRLQTDVSK